MSLGTETLPFPSMIRTERMTFLDAQTTTATTTATTTTTTTTATTMANLNIMTSVNSSVTDRRSMMMKTELFLEDAVARTSLEENKRNANSFVFKKIDNGQLKLTMAI